MLKPPHLEDLSDPTQLTQLPFPSISDLLPTSQFDTVNGKWDYMGREKFTQVLHKFGKLMMNPNTGFWLCGTIGYGKSHSKVEVFLGSGKKAQVTLSENPKALWA